MTMTHILLTLRASIPQPFARDRWPEFTTSSPSDVTVAGVSMIRLAHWCGTPCVHTAAAVIPGTNGAPSPTELASVLVTRVLEISRGRDGSLDVWIDAQLSSCRVNSTEIRMVGRVSRVPDTVGRIHAAGEHAPVMGIKELVSDLRVDDLLVIPCSGTVRLCEIDPNRLHLISQETRTASENENWSPLLCRR